MENSPLVLNALISLITFVIDHEKNIVCKKSFTKIREIIVRKLRISLKRIESDTTKQLLFLNSGVRGALTLLSLKDNRCCCWKHANVFGCKLALCDEKLLMIFHYMLNHLLNTNSPLILTNSQLLSLREHINCALKSKKLVPKNTVRSSKKYGT
tara:strand:- start:482 stop:943 length:462 start_codon:yes stop_codon:yes gene_type:complete